MSTDLNIESLFRYKTIPVVVLDEPDRAIPLAQSLERADISCIEITLRTPQAMDAIREVAGETDIYVGAGTVLSVDQARQAITAGAEFIVSPGTNPEVVKFCVAEGIPIFPGVCSPTEVELAASLGLTAVKFFPAEAAGGVPFLKAISAPYQDISFIPTGGINADNFESYAALPSVLACGSSWIVDRKLIETEQWSEIERRCGFFRDVIGNL